MKIYIWNQIEQLTYRYHSNGGAVVIAKDIEEALELLKKEDAKITKEEISEVEIFDVKAKESKVWIFPDAGCC